MRIVGAVTLLTTILAVTSSSFAMDYPFSFSREQNIDVHQVGHVRFTIDPRGHLTGEDFWSNGKKTSGNTFYAIVVLVDKDGKSIWSNQQTKGLDGSWTGHAREGRVSLDYQLSRDQMNAFDHAEVKLGVMNCGWELTEFHCCNNGIEATFTERKCNVPKTLRR
jgi:hypothetical protein